MVRGIADLDRDAGGKPFYHGGADLRADAGASVVAPVAGTLEGGFFVVTAGPGGSIAKQWTPWAGVPGPGFELAITTDDGFRYELEGIDSARLPARTLELLSAGHGRVEAGAVVGLVGTAESPHLQYNIVRADGARINPEAVSAPWPEPAPAIAAVYAVDVRGIAARMEAGQALPSRPAWFVVEAGEGGRAPAYAAIRFAHGSHASWDFRRGLAAPGFGFPDITRVFQLAPVVGVAPAQAGNALIRLPMQSSDQGAFTITVGTASGRTVDFSASVGDQGSG